MDTAKIGRWSVFVFIAIIGVVLLWRVNAPSAPDTEIAISQLAADMLAGQVEAVSVSGDGRNLNITYSDQTERFAEISGASSLETLLASYGVDASVYADGVTVTYQSESNLLNYLAPVFTFLSVALIVGFIYFLYRQSQRGNHQALSFGKSNARLFLSDHPTVTFADVAGVEEAKEELNEIVEFLREPDKFISYGARIPKGVLLVGSPGTGKTLLAKAVSGEAGVPFFSIAGSEFVEMFVGVGASRVRDLFEQAKRHSPCIIFVDEIDAVGRQRGAGLGGGHDEREQTLNQILVEMDGFGTDTHIIILAATNRPDILDPALLRPGRFDRRVIIDRPDLQGREAIFQVHSRGKPVSKHVDVRELARSTPGFSGADIENAMNEAALLAARRNRPNIGMNEIHEAIERVQLGPERKSRVMPPDERELVAYHEAGHAVVAHYLPDAHPLRKVTIIPRGQAGGVTWFLEDDQSFVTAARCRASIATALGGRVAEELVFNNVTTGAHADLKKVTQIARAMVTQYGMSDTLGLRVYGDKQEMIFLGREISEQRDYSDAIAEQIDREVSAIIDYSYTTAKQILTDHRDKLDLVADSLLQIETLDAEQFTTLIETGELLLSRQPRVKQPASVPQPAQDWHKTTIELPTSPSLA